MKFLSLLIGLTLFGACSTTKQQTTATTCKGEEIKDCICTHQYDPVCGCDGKTYGNSCSANCAGIKEYTKGECEKNTTSSISDYAPLKVTKIEHGKDGYVATLQNDNGNYFSSTISIPNLGNNYIDLKVGDRVKIEGDYSEKATWITINGEHPTYIKATKIIKTN